MRAVIVREHTHYDQAEYGTLDDPTPGRGEMLVTLHAAEANFPDILYIEGKYQATPPFPFSPGLAGSGRIEAIGEGVKGFEIGQKVLVLPEYGAYAEKICAPASYCFPVPEDMPFDVAASFGLVYQTAYFALKERGRMREGDAVLVLGATGGVGMAAVQLAKALGAGCVMAATRGEGGASFAREIGADVTIDSSAHDLKDRLRKLGYEHTAGRGANVVIDVVGGELTGAALRVVAWCGQLVIVGFASGDIPKIAANYLLVKNIGVSGLQWTDYRARQPERVREAQATIFELWKHGKLAPRITRTLPLSRYAEALKDLSSANARGKIILTTTVENTCIPKPREER